MLFYKFVIAYLQVVLESPDGLRLVVRQIPNFIVDELELSRHLLVHVVQLVHGPNVPIDLLELF